MRRCSPRGVQLVTLGSRLTQHAPFYTCKSERRKWDESKRVSTDRRLLSVAHAIEATRDWVASLQRPCLLCPYVSDVDKVRLKSDKTRAKPAARRQPSFLTDEERKISDSWNKEKGKTRWSLKCFCSQRLSHLTLSTSTFELMPKFIFILNTHQVSLASVRLCYVACLASVCWYRCSIF